MDLLNVQFAVEDLLSFSVALRGSVLSVDVGLPDPESLVCIPVSDRVRVFPISLCLFLKIASKLLLNCCLLTL